MRQPEARDEHATKLDNVLYTIIALVNIKTSKNLLKTKLEVEIKTRFFWYRNIRDT